MQNEVFHTVVALQLIGDAAFKDDDDPVGQLFDFVFFVGYDDHTQALARQLAQEAVKLLLGADIDAACRAQGDNHFGVAAQGAGKHHLLLIAAAQVRDRLLQRRGDDVGLPGQPGHVGVLQGVPDEAQRIGQHVEPAHGDVLSHAENADIAADMAITGDKADGREGLARACDLAVRWRVLVPASTSARLSLPLPTGPASATISPGRTWKSMLEAAKPLRPIPLASNSTSPLRSV